MTDVPNRIELYWFEIRYCFDENRSLGDGFCVALWYALRHKTFFEDYVTRIADKP